MFLPVMKYLSLPVGHDVLVQWTASQPGLLTSCSASSDGRFVVCAADPQNGVYVCDAASGQTLQRVTGTTNQTPRAQSGLAAL